MKKIILLLFFLIPATFAKTEPYTCPKYTEDPVEILRPTTLKDSKLYPLVVYLPATDMEAKVLYKHMASPASQKNTVSILLPGAPKRSDYEKNFVDLLSCYEKILAKTLKQFDDDPHIDTKNITVAGFSLGGDMAWSMSVRQPFLFQNAIIMGSRMSYPLSSVRAKKLAQSGEKFWLFMGEDDIEARKNGMKSMFKSLKKYAIPTQMSYFHGKHEIPEREYFDTILETLWKNN